MVGGDRKSNKMLAQLHLTFLKDLSQRVFARPCFHKHANLRIEVSLDSVLFTDSSSWTLSAVGIDQSTTLFIWTPAALVCAHPSSGEEVLRANGEEATKLVETSKIRAISIVSRDLTDLWLVKKALREMIPEVSPSGVVYKRDVYAFEASLYQPGVVIEIRIA